MVGRSKAVISKMIKLTKEDWQKLFQKIDTILFDADGVLWNANASINGSAEAVNKLNALGKRVGLLTNNSTKSREQYFEKCQRLGFQAFKKETIVTTAAVFANHLSQRNFEGTVYVVGSRGIGNELDKVGIPHIGIGVKAVVVGFDGHFSYVKCMKAASYLKNPSCLWIATNTDESVPSADPNYAIPGTGTIVASVMEASGRKPEVLGKPCRPTFEYVCSLFKDLDPEKTLMVGDRCKTDIKFGNDHGMATILVLSGDTDISLVEKYKQDGRMDLVPDFYTDSVSDLAKML